MGQRAALWWLVVSLYQEEHAILSWSGPQTGHHGSVSHLGHGSVMDLWTSEDKSIYQWLLGEKIWDFSGQGSVLGPSPVASVS